MSSSIAAATGNFSLARLAAVSAPTPSRDSTSASKSIGTAATDTISLSAKAQTLLTVSADLAEFEAQLVTSQMSAQAGKGSFAQSYERSSIAYGRNGEAEYAVVSKKFFDTRFVTAFVSGNATECDMIDVAAFVDPQPNPKGG